jgi:restriction system protein
MARKTKSSRPARADRENDALPPGGQLLPVLSWYTAWKDNRTHLRAQLNPSPALLASTGVIEPPVQPTVTLLLQTVIVPGEKTSEGTIIQAVALPWFEIIEHLKGDWNIAYQISPEKWEEMIAGAYKRAGFNPVTLTPRSGDHGRDVIAIKKGLGVGRVIDQVKRYKPPRLVDANDVRALMGVLHTDGASKGFLTTTSDFAPGIRSDPLISPLIPSRLELINGDQLLRRLEELADRPPPPRGRRTAR